MMCDGGGSLTTFEKIYSGNNKISNIIIKQIWLIGIIKEKPERCISRLHSVY